MKVKLNRAVLALIASTMMVHGESVLNVDLAVASFGAPILAVDLAGTAEDGFQVGFTGSDIVNGVTVAVSKNYSADATLSSGTIGVRLRASSQLALLEDRGNLSDESPEGFTYAELYEDTINALGTEGSLTLTLSGLNPNQEYHLTVYSYDPRSTSSAADKVWSITQGTPPPQSQSVNYGTSLSGNNTFAMVFSVTSTVDGVVAVQNTAGFPQAAINGFMLSIPEQSTIGLLSA